MMDPRRRASAFASAKEAGNGHPLPQVRRGREPSLVARDDGLRLSVPVYGNEFFRKASVTVTLSIQPLTNNLAGWQAQLIQL
jgi:hypothetical protein